MSVNKPIWKIKDWIDITKLCNHNLSKNPKAIDYLKENKDLINWYCLSSIPEAIDLLLENKDMIDWKNVLKEFFVE